MVLSAVAVLVPGLAASAATTQQTAIKGFVASASRVNYQQVVTFTGTLVAGPAGTPVPDEPIALQLEPNPRLPFAALASGRTGADGTFSIATTLPEAGYVRARFAGDAGLSPSAAAVYSAVVQLPSRILVDPIPASVPAGTAVTFSGTLQVQIDGAWRPFAGGSLSLGKWPSWSGYDTTSDADGRFSVTAPVSEDSSWQVTIGVGGLYRGTWYPDPTYTDYRPILALSRTRILGFAVPARAEAHHVWSAGLPATGRVERWNGSAWVPLTACQIDLYYRPKGSGTWRQGSIGQCAQGGGPAGAFRANLDLHLGTSDWRARITPQADTLTSVSTTATNTLTDRTHVAAIAITRRPKITWIDGRITDWYNGGVTFTSLRGFKVRVYYRAKGSTTWHAGTTATLDSEGFFSVSSPKTSGYSFKVVLPAHGPVLGCSSKAL